MSLLWKNCGVGHFSRDAFRVKLNYADGVFCTEIVSNMQTDVFKLVFRQKQKKSVSGIYETPALIFCVQWSLKKILRIF